MSPSNLPKMRIRLILRASILAVAMVGWMAAPALAAPTVLSTDPEEGAEMHEAPGEVTIEFSEPLESSSGMTVEDGCGNEVSEGDARVVGTAMNELNVVVGAAPHHGTYTVEYVATGVTGTATGSFTFVVHGGSACGGTGGGGGHHGGGGDDGNDGGGHGGHGDDEGKDGNGGGGQHSGHDGAGGTNSSDTDHAGMDMSGHGEHQEMKHPKKKHAAMDHGKHKPKKRGGKNNPPFAAPEVPTFPTDIPTGTTVVIALGLAVLMGLIGGWVLRVSSSN